MRVLALDIGSSSIKAAILRNGKPVGTISHAAYPTVRKDTRAEVDPNALLQAISKAIASIPAAKKADILALSVMSSAWVAMDSRGKTLTPIITHQDRRSIDDARALLREIGEKSLLKITGSLPFPGGISSTTHRWMFRNLKQLKRKAALVGPLNTFLHRVLTGACVTDPGNASFMGLFQTLKLRSWSPLMLSACGGTESILPDVLEGDAIAGRITHAAADTFGLLEGLPMTTGVIDTSAAMLLAGADEGRLLHICGTTDVLALCTNQPHPHPRLLTRGLGLGGKFLIAATLASAGSTLDWAKATFFADFDDTQFVRLVRHVSRLPDDPAVIFDPYLAGERTNIEQRTAALAGLSLRTDRNMILRSILAALARASAQRFPLLMKNRKVKRNVLVSGGGAKILAPLFHADLPRRLHYHYVEQATLLGLWKLAQRPR